jgi:hypothetical protein
MPREGSRVATESGYGIIVGQNTLEEKVLVQYETGARLEIPLSRVKVVDMPQPPRPQQPLRQNQPARPLKPEAVSPAAVAVAPQNAPSEAAASPEAEAPAAPEAPETAADLPGASEAVENQAAPTEAECPAPPADSAAETENRVDDTPAA